MQNFTPRNFFTSETFSPQKLYFPYDPCTTVQSFIWPMRFPFLLSSPWDTCSFDLLQNFFTSDSNPRRQKGPASRIGAEYGTLSQNGYGEHYTQLRDERGLCYGSNMLHNGQTHTRPLSGFFSRAHTTSPKPHTL